MTDCYSGALEEKVTSGPIVIDFDEAEETIPELADGQSFDEKL